MRMRFKPYARPELLACDFHVHEPLTHAGHWRELFARPEQPFCLELGCGKGGFLAQLAPSDPTRNFLGIDITDKVLILAKRKVEKAYLEKQLPPDNVLIASLDIERMSGAFSPEDRVARIYINFCNPWSKNASSHKHRLTHPRQLLQYRALMDEGAEIWFKTDDDDLFRDSLSYFRQQALRSPGRPTTSMPTSLPGTCVPSMRACSPSRASPSRHSSPVRGRIPP